MESLVLSSELNSPQKDPLRIQILWRNLAPIFPFGGKHAYARVVWFKPYARPSTNAPVFFFANLPTSAVGKKSCVILRVITGIVVWIRVGLSSGLGRTVRSPAIG